MAREVVGPRVAAETVGREGDGRGGAEGDDISIRTAESTDMHMIKPALIPRQMAAAKRIIRERD